MVNFNINKCWLLLIVVYMLAFMLFVLYLVIMEVVACCIICLKYTNNLKNYSSLTHIHKGI